MTEFNFGPKYFLKDMFKISSDERHRHFIDRGLNVLPMRHDSTLGRLLTGHINEPRGEESITDRSDRRITGLNMQF